MDAAVYYPEIATTADAAPMKFRWFALCLIAPVAFDFARKVIPGNPYFLLAAAYPVVFIAWMVALAKRGNRMPMGIRVPLVAWILFQLIYWLLAMTRDFEVGMIAFFTHIAPVGMAWVAYAAMSRYDALRNSYRLYAIVGLLLLPFGMIAIVSGTANFPAMLRTNADMIELGRELRAGFSAFAGVFNTQAVMSMTYLAAAYLSLAYICGGTKGRRGSTLLWLVLIASIILVFSSTRRGALLGIVPGLLFVIFRVRSMKVKSFLLVSMFAALALMFHLDSRSERESNQGFEGRLGFLAASDFSDRYQNVFLHFWFEAMQDYPLGTILGSASREGNKLGLHEWSITEVGAATVTKETGVAGSFIILIAVISLVVVEWRMARRLGRQSKAFCQLLILFQLVFFILWFCKEKQAVAGATLAHVLFWAVPGIVAGIHDRELWQSQYQEQESVGELPLDYARS